MEQPSLIQSSSTMDLDTEHVLPQSQAEQSEWFGYKFVGDNIDESIRASRQRPGLPNKSLHNFHGYALRDRVDLSGLSDTPPSVSTPDPELFIPSDSDVTALKEELTMLISR